MKRALEVAAAGGHNLLITGPLVQVRPWQSGDFQQFTHLTLEESIEVTKIYSVAGLLKKKELIKERPFRAPHHTSSSISLIGGGRIPRPGEVSLAHNGVLFWMNYLNSKTTLEVLRQPMEDGEVNISRINASLSYPSEFMLVASMNPCPCGYLGDPLHECKCSQRDIQRYLGKISHPLLDRIDIHLEVQPVKYDDLKTEINGESSSQIRDRVKRAREIQLDRFRRDKIYTNAQMSNKLIKKYCNLSPSSEKIMAQGFKKYKFSARTYNKILRVSRTIADLAGERDITDSHVLEALGYRSLNINQWG